MKKLITIGSMALLSLNIAQAQEELPYGYYIDAARFSRTLPGGTARIQGLGGTQIALGADPSTIYSNPAGLGLYNRSEVSFTPSLSFNNTDSEFNGSTRSTFDNRFKIDHFGIVFNRTKEGTSGWLGGSFGISVNKINDFDRTIRYSGRNSQNSINDFFIESANGLPTNQFPNLSNASDITTLAFNSYLIGPLNIIDSSFPDDEYFSDVTSFYRPSVQQEETIVTSGGQYQWNFSYGGNYGDFFYFGLGLGITNLDYHERKTYTESSFDYSEVNPAYDPISNIIIREDLHINGTGFNGNFGVIFRPLSIMRFGLTLTTPTIYNLNDRYSADMNANWNNFFYEDIIGGDTTLNNIFTQSAIVVSRYKLRTPLKLALGGVLFLGNNGFVTLDAEYLNYGKMNLSSSELSMDADNQFISNNFSSSLNLRAGAEIRFDVLRFRAGFALDNVPTNQTIDYDKADKRISGGIGLNLNQFLFDLSVSHTSQTSDYSPYALADGSQPIAKNHTNDFLAALTLGYKF